MTQRIQEQGRGFSAIEAELHLREIGWEVLCADLVPRTYNAPLEETKGRLNRVRCDALSILVTNVLLGHVIDGFMFHLADRRLVGLQGVGNDYVHISADVLSDVLLQRAGFRIFNMEEPNISAALPDADNYFLRSLGSFGTPAQHFSANVGFVHLDSTFQHWTLCLFHGCSNPVAEIPRRFVRTFVQSPDRALELQGAHTFLGLTEQENGEKPLLQGQMRIVEDRASGDAELIVAILAVKQLLRCREFNYWTVAAETVNVIRPAKAHKQLAAFVVSVEQVYNVN